MSFHQQNCLKHTSGVSMVYVAVKAPVASPVPVARSHTFALVPPPHTSVTISPVSLVRTWICQAVWCLWKPRARMHCLSGYIEVTENLIKSLAWHVITSLCKTSLLNSWPIFPKSNPTTEALFSKTSFWSIPTLPRYQNLTICWCSSMFLGHMTVTPPVPWSDHRCRFLRQFI